MEMASLRETTLVESEGVTFVVVRFLKSIIMKRFQEEFVMGDIEPLQNEWNQEDQELVNEDARPDTLEEELYDSREEWLEGIGVSILSSQS